MDKGYFSHLLTALLKKEWEEEMWKYEEFNHVLRRHHCAPGDLVNGSAFRQMMEIQCGFMAAEVTRHAKQNYTRFYERWQKLCQVPDSDDNLIRKLDPDTTPVPELLKAMWKMKIED